MAVIMPLPMNENAKQFSHRQRDLSIAILASLIFSLPLGLVLSVNNDDPKSDPVVSSSHAFARVYALATGQTTRTDSHIGKRKPLRHPAEAASPSLEEASAPDSIGLTSVEPSARDHSFQYCSLRPGRAPPGSL